MALYRTRLGVPDEAEDRAVGAFVDVDLGSDADLGSQAFDVVPEPLRLRLFGMEILAGGSRSRIASSTSKSTIVAAPAFRNKPGFAAASSYSFMRPRPE
jgi:hypothetical protein